MPYGFRLLILSLYSCIDYKSNAYEIETSDAFYGVVHALPYKDKVVCDSLYMEYTRVLEVCSITGRDP